MIVVDTTVLVYAVGVDHPLKQPSARLIAAVGAGAVRATTTPEVIQEFAHVRSRRVSRRGAASLARRYAQLFSPLVPSDEAALAQALTLYERQPQLDSFDALLAATALSRGAEALVSADAAFGGVPRLRHVRPGSAEFDRLLEA